MYTEESPDSKEQPSVVTAVTWLFSGLTPLIWIHALPGEVCLGVAQILHPLKTLQYAAGWLWSTSTVGPVRLSPTMVTSWSSQLNAPRMRTFDTPFRVGCDAQVPP